MMPRTRPIVSRRERPAKPALTREGIVTAAVGVMQAEGLDKVTMRRLAQELDTGAASLYVYVRNTAELHAAMLEQLLGQIDLSLAEAILALLSAGGVPPARAAWAVDILLHFATSTAAEQGTRHRAADADDEQDALAEALREAPAGTFPQIAALGPELLSGAGPDRLDWGFRVLISGITQTPRPQEREPRGNPQPPGA